MIAQKKCSYNEAFRALNHVHFLKIFHCSLLAFSWPRDHKEWFFYACTYFYVFVKRKKNHTLLLGNLSIFWNDKISNWSSLTLETTSPRRFTKKIWRRNIEKENIYLSKSIFLFEKLYVRFRNLQEWFDLDLFFVPFFKNF